MAKTMYQERLDAENEFRREVRVRQAYYDLTSQSALGEDCGIPQSTLSKRFSKPENLTVAELRKLNSSLHLDPGAVLGLLGFSKKEIRKYRESVSVREGA